MFRCALCGQSGVTGALAAPAVEVETSPEHGIVCCRRGCLGASETHQRQGSVIPMSVQCGQIGPSGPPVRPPVEVERGTR